MFENHPPESVLSASLQKPGTVPGNPGPAAQEQHTSRVRELGRHIIVFIRGLFSKTLKTLCYYAFL